MANKVYNITDAPDKYDILSQTPKNYNKDNYFLKELQDKVNAEWTYRPNRVDVEFEQEWGSEKYAPMEVVVQSVKSDKGQDLSNDCRRIVFRDITESRFKRGSKFRFSKNYDLNEFDKNKNIWIVTNFDRASVTSSVIIERCNGSIGSTYVDKQGVTRYHYEPVIQGRELLSTNLRYSDPIVSPQSQLTIICQHNDYTKDYFINQRFVIGYDKVYRITAVNKYYTDTTFIPDDIGLMKIYLELTEKSPYDNFETRIAYQQEPNVVLNTTENGQVGDLHYSIGFKKPQYIPTNLGKLKIEFNPYVMIQDGTEVPDIPITTTISLQRLPEHVDISKYILFEQEMGSNDFSLQRVKLYPQGNLIVTCHVNEENSPSGEAFSTEFEMVVSQPEAGPIL